MDANENYNAHELLDDTRHQSPKIKSEPVEAPSEAIMPTESKSIELDSRPRAKSQSFPTRASRYMTPNTIRLLLQILSVLTFCGVLIPYMQYSKAKKAAIREICKQDARILYENNLDRCEVKAATGLRGGALGLNWLEMGMVVIVAVAWQYAMWFAQGWLILRISFLKKNAED
ncbi:hypothetical protein H2200_003089 [Cladophialophora chaetospira]|uniref:Uncharacterized protein n=1 Tax=Cladophialophora chaetospira TaxID=386627 RepID=A0AA38XGP0_9EURO|nr:hypothetical protein H2200_003089 [Cladophialophora chaetospira]